MQINLWTIRETLKNGINLQSQEEKICFILHTLEQIIKGERLSFYRFSPVGYVGEGIAMLENGRYQSINYIRDDIRVLPVIRQAIDKQRPFYYAGQDIITQITSRYTRNDPLYALLVIPVIMNQITISYMLCEFVKQDLQIEMGELEELLEFGKIAGELLIQPQIHSHPKLSPRECEIMKALANGLSTKEMTDLLHLSEATIKQYIKSIMGKLDAKNRAHAVSIYMAQNL
ncbi:MAG TPA: helix-turn-helix transcriptional regulator [Ureibacillus sp.]|nr:helix-turn-helix transcriptional regulator [Ureibacillus sp.]